MNRALKSAFFRFFRTKLFIMVLIISVLIGAGIILDTGVLYITSDIFSRPRVIANDFLFYCILKQSVVIPVAAAVFCTKFTGTDISHRSINNKISTGMKRTHIFFADYIVTMTAVFMSIVINLLMFYAFARYLPLRSYIKINSQILGLVLQSILVCIAYVSLYLLVQYFVSTKLLALILSLLLMPAVYMGTFSLESILDQPYRKSVKNEQTEETVWEINPYYVGGAARDVIDYVYRSSVFYELETENVESDKASVVSGVVIVLSSAAGLVAINKKEYS